MPTEHSIHNITDTSQQTTVANPFDGHQVPARIRELTLLLTRSCQVACPHYLLLLFSRWRACYGCQNEWCTGLTC